MGRVPNDDDILRAAMGDLADGASQNPQQPSSEPNRSNRIKPDDDAILRAATGDLVDSVSQNTQQSSSRNAQQSGVQNAQQASAQNAYGQNVNNIGGNVYAAADPPKKTLRKVLYGTIAAVLIVAILCGGVVFLFTKNKGFFDDSVNESLAGGEVSRATFVQMVYDNFAFNGCQSTDPYYNDVSSDNQNFKAIQCSYEWGYIEKTNANNNFYPNNSATTYFAALVAVKAVGIDVINASGYSLKSERDILKFYSDKTGYNLQNEELLTAADAKAFINSIAEIEGSLKLKEHSDIHYADNAYVVKDNAITLNESAKTAELLTKQNVKVGDYIVLESSAQYYSGKAVKVTSVNGNSITYEDANVEDVLTDVYITGSAVPEIVGFSCEDKNTTIRELDSTEVAFDENREVTVVPLGTAKTPEATDCIGGKLNIGDKAFEITSKINQNCSVKVKFALTNITAHVYLDANLENCSIERFKFGFSSTAKLQATITGKLEKAIPSPPMRLEASFFKIIGIGINVSLKVSVSGSVTLTYSFDQSTYINYKKGCTPRITPSVKFKDPEIKLEAKADLLVNFSISPDLLTKPIIDVGIAGGVEGAGSLNQYNCLDLDLYLVLYCYAGSGDSIIGGLAKLDFTRNIITKENSPWKEHLHIEDFKVVPKCTKGNNKPTAKEDKKGKDKTKEKEKKKKVNAGDWRQAYIDFLYNFMDEAEYPESCGFSLVYIDNDDTPELVVRDGDAHYSAASVYTCVNSKVVELVVDLSGTFGIIGYAEREGVIHSNVTYHGCSTTTIYRVDAGACKKVISLYSNEADTPEGETPEYKINDKSVSKKKYNAAWKKYENDKLISSFDSDNVLTSDNIESINSF